MKRLLTAAVTALSVACGLPPSDRVSPFDGQSASCFTVVVDNQNFADVHITHAQTGLPVGMNVTGLAITRLEVCNMNHREAVFDIDAIGGAFEHRVSLPNYLQAGERYHIVIGPFPRSVPQFFPGASLGTNGNRFVALGSVRVTPFAFYRGIYQDVSRCLGVPVDFERFDSLAFYVSEHIVDLQEETLAYGVTEFRNPDDLTPVAVYFEREYAFNAYVISHELVHVILGSMEEPTRCLMPVAAIDGVRSAPADVLERARNN